MLLLLRRQSRSVNWEKAAKGALALDSASVELAVSTLPKCWGTGPLGPLNNDGGGLNGVAFAYHNCSVSDYVEFAYKLWLTPSQEQFLISQLPAWAVTNRYNIELKGPGNSTKDQKRLTMQALLAHRFKLAVHFEAREVPVFALVLAYPGGPGPQLQVHPKESSCSARCQSQPMFPRSLFGATV